MPSSATLQHICSHWTAFVCKHTHIVYWLTNRKCWVCIPVPSAWPNTPLLSFLHLPGYVVKPWPFHILFFFVFMCTHHHPLSDHSAGVKLNRMKRAQMHAWLVHTFLSPFSFSSKPSSLGLCLCTLSTADTNNRQKKCCNGEKTPPLSLFHRPSLPVLCLLLTFTQCLLTQIHRHFLPHPAGQFAAVCRVYLLVCLPLPSCFLSRACSELMWSLWRISLTANFLSAAVVLWILLLSCRLIYFYFTAQRELLL